MNCQEFWNTMPELEDRHEPLDRHTEDRYTEDRYTEDRHSEQCAACAARLRSQRALKAGLRAVASQMSHTGAPARVELRLRAAFRTHNAIQVYAPMRLDWMPALTWGAAAAAVFCLALFLVRSRQPEAPNVAAEWSIAQMAMTGTQATDGETDGDTATDTSNKGFIALPNAAAIGPNEDVNMVRVEVPRSAMIALGFEVNPEQAWQPVQAEVMLGADGLARAVRFLD